MWRQRRSSQETSSEGLGQGPGCTLQDMHNNIFVPLNSKNPQQMKSVKYSSFQIEGTREAHQEKGDHLGPD